MQEITDTLEHKLLENKFCRQPWDTFGIKGDGLIHSVQVCCHEGTGAVGKMDWANPMKAWNSPGAQELRSTILDGSFKKCIASKCMMLTRLVDREYAKTKPYYKNILDNNLTKLETVPNVVSHDTDFTCNLSCPSCRTKLNFNNSKTHQEKVKHELTTIVEKFPKLKLLNLSGSGDPFASFGARDWLLNFDPDKYPHLKFDIRTNGTMLTPRLWNRLSNIHNSINELRISTDAATEKTYNKLRPGGNWNVLLRNIENISKNTEKFQFCIDIVVQTDNFRELPDCIKLARSFEVDGMKLGEIQNFGHFSEDQLFDKQVWKPEHKYHTELIEIMQDPIFRDMPLLSSRVTELIPSWYVKWPMRSPENRNMLYNTDLGRNIMLRTGVWSIKNRIEIIRMMLAYPKFKDQLIDVFKTFVNHGTTL